MDLDRSLCMLNAYIFFFTDLSFGNVSGVFLFMFHGWDIYFGWAFLLACYWGVFHLSRKLRSAWTEERDSEMGGAFVVYVLCFQMHGKVNGQGTKAES